MSYSFKIEIPHFNPKNADVKIDELVNIDKYKELMNDIELMKEKNLIDENQYKFLILGATRFLQFNYANIAEYYCKADRNMQEMMEKEMLVLIDVNNKFAESFLNLKKYFQPFMEKIRNDNENIDDNETTLNEMF